jgi:lipoprotein-anchoring transpeptidase ErfK/SrfK
MAMMAVAPAAQTRPQKAGPAPLSCGDYLTFQVLLDMHGFSVGEIDGQPGPNFWHAVAAFQAARQLPATGEADCASWQALGGDAGISPFVPYRITDADVGGPFVTSIPRELPAQADLPALGYRSALELLAERFHAAPATLRRLNPAAQFAANEEIQVPNVMPFDPVTRPAPDAAIPEVIVTVSRDDSALRVLRPDRSLVFFAPVTTGSEHDPLPLGDWKVTGVSWNPPFHYNPDLFWDAKDSHQKATLKPGPNNPVGVVWIDVNIEHYGIHGTPEPGRVGHAESHGCVRLTNWDAARLAGLVKPGTPVHFE